MQSRKIAMFSGILVALVNIQVLCNGNNATESSENAQFNSSSLTNDQEDATTDPDPYFERFKAKADAAILKLIPNSDNTDRNMISSTNSSLELVNDPLFLDYGVHSEVLEQPLMVGPEKTLHYRVLVNTPNGRHLLLVSLLEHLSDDIWTGKCKGKLKMFLPNSLKSPLQPLPPLDAFLLDNIIIKDRVVLREEVMDKLNMLVPEYVNSEMFTWFDNEHRSVIKSVVSWVMEQETFQSSFSLLVTIKERLSTQMFVELVNLVISGRDDTGFAMPSIESYMPEHFFRQESLASFYGQSEEDNVGRGGRQVVVWTGTDWPESEWYFREDPVANGHHLEWHRTAILPFDRWGEYFYYMHSQMMARYQAERLSLGLGLATLFGPEQWDKVVQDSYDPRLGGDWTPRLPGTIESRWSVYMYSYLEEIKIEIDELVPQGYVQGIDEGINNLGEKIEFGLHNIGHVLIGWLSEGRGVMGYTSVAIRDPIFFRWHGFIETLFKDYKNRLSPYSEADLSFPGVASVSASVQSEGRAPNTFYTYREMATASMDNLDNPVPGTRMSLQYLRMNHRPFTWNIVINSFKSGQTPAIVRIFLMPANQTSNKVTLHMDHFFMNLSFGENRITRDELDAPHLSKSRWSLGDLQDSLLNGQLDRGQFSWGGCGWPRHLNIPRGTEEGMDWKMVVMVSQVLPEDIPKINTWAANSNISWTFCGVTTGVVPDSRPLGFPVDRDFGDISDLVGYRTNWAVVPVTILYNTNTGHEDG